MATDDPRVLIDIGDDSYIVIELDRVDGTPPSGLVSFEIWHKEKREHVNMFYPHQASAIGAALSTFAIFAARARGEGK